MPKVRRQYTGGAVAATLASPVGASAVTTFNVSGGGTPSGWPSSSATPFYVVLSPQTSVEEKMLVTISGATLTIVTRAVDGTSAGSHAGGASIYPVFTATDASEANELTSTYVSQGSMVYQGVSTFTELPISASAGYTLLSSGTVPVWGQVAAAGIATDAVTSVKILNGAVTSDKILDGTIVAGDLASNAVSTVKIADAAVTSPKLAAPTLTTKSGDFTLALVDSNCTLQCTSSGNTAVTVPDSSIAFAVGSVVTLVNLGSAHTTFGVVTIGGASGVNVRSSNGLKLRTQYSAATLVKISDTSWVLTGDTVA
jgi:hypothetical protein